jgi:hypothetical protein
MVEVNGVVFKIGGYVQGVLEDLKEFPKHDWDNVILVTGREGDGKTNFVLLASYYLDQTVNADRWVYNSKQFEELIDKDDLPPGSNIIWDESDELAGSSSNAIINIIKRKLKRIRYKNYTIWLITPTFFDMNVYNAVFRTRCLFDVYAEPRRNKETGKFEPNRGRVKFYSYDTKRQLYFKGKEKYWDMEVVKSDFYDAFGKVPEGYPIDMNVLKVKKDEAAKDLADEKDNVQVKASSLRAEYVSRVEQWMFSNYNIKCTNKDLSWMFKVDERTIRRDKVTFDKKFASVGGDVSVLDGGTDKITSVLPESMPVVMKGAEVQLE